MLQDSRTGRTNTTTGTAAGPTGVGSRTITRRMTGNGCSRRSERTYEMVPTSDLIINDFDDERTLDEEEAMEGSEDSHNELSNLQKEGDMPLKELLAKYGYSQHTSTDNSNSSDQLVIARDGEDPGLEMNPEADKTVTGENDADDFEDEEEEEEDEEDDGDDDDEDDEDDDEEDGEERTRRVRRKIRSKSQPSLRQFYKEMVKKEQEEEQAQRANAASGGKSAVSGHQQAQRATTSNGNDEHTDDIIFDMSYGEVDREKRSNLVAAHNNNKKNNNNSNNNNINRDTSIQATGNTNPGSNTHVDGSNDNSASNNTGRRRARAGDEEDDEEDEEDDDDEEEEDDEDNDGMPSVRVGQTGVTGVENSVGSNTGNSGAGSGGGTSGNAVGSTGNVVVVDSGGGNSAGGVVISGGGSGGGGGGGSSRLLRSVSRPQSEEEDDDCDYSPDEEEWKKTIMVGSDYQATIPEGLCRYDDALPYENEDKILWNPSFIPEEETEEFLERAQLPVSNKVNSLPAGAHVRDDEQALYLLLQCGYNLDEALRRRRMNVLPPTDAISLWSEEECHNFESGLRSYGKDFHLIQKNKVRTRSVGELVQFYYLWKKTERHDIFTYKARLEKKKYALHPGITDYMDRFLEEQEGVRDRSSSPNVNCLILGDVKRQRASTNMTNHHTESGKSVQESWDGTAVNEDPLGDLSNNDTMTGTVTSSSSSSSPPSTTSSSLLPPPLPPSSVSSAALTTHTATIQSSSTTTSTSLSSSVPMPSLLSSSTTSTTTTTTGSSSQPNSSSPVILKNHESMSHEYSSPTPDNVLSHLPP